MPSRSQQLRFHFNDAKTAQAAAHMLRLNGGTMPYMVLIKLLYLADRQMLLEHCRPITGDHLVSMRHGPVLSHVLDFITHGPKRDPQTAWFTLIGVPHGYDVSIKDADAEASTDELSPDELTLMQVVHSKYGSIGNSDLWELVKLLHNTLPEWKDPVGGASNIEYEDILRAEGRSDDDIASIKSEADSVWLLNSLGG